MEELVQTATEDITQKLKYYEIAWQSFLKWLGDFAPKLFSALILFVIGYILIRVLMRLFNALLVKSNLSLSLHAFLKSLVKITLMVLLALSCAGMLGVPTTSIVTALGAVGLAVSLAVKDSLTNLAGGMMTLFAKPFAVGDFVSLNNDVSGTVSEIGLIYTRLNTIDNKHIYVPNGDIPKAIITNFSSEAKRRLDLVFSIGYSDDFKKAQAIIHDLVYRHEYSLMEPAPVIRMCEHAGSSINIACRVWVENAHYWDLNFDLLEQVKERFDAEGISIPFNQMDVHLVQEPPVNVANRI